MSNPRVDTALALIHYFESEGKTSSKEYRRLINAKITDGSFYLAMLSCCNYFERKGLTRLKEYRLVLDTIEEIDQSS